MAKKTSKSREAHRVCNVVPSRKTETDWHMKHAVQAGAIKAPPATLPANVDLRASWWDIGDQESTGSCVGWGSTDGVATGAPAKAPAKPRTTRKPAAAKASASAETVADEDAATTPKRRTTRKTTTPAEPV